MRVKAIRRSCKDHHAATSKVTRVIIVINLYHLHHHHHQATTSKVTRLSQGDVYLQNILCTTNHPVLWGCVYVQHFILNKTINQVEQLGLKSFVNSKPNREMPAHLE